MRILFAYILNSYWNSIPVHDCLLLVIDVADACGSYYRQPEGMDGKLKVSSFSSLGAFVAASVAAVAGAVADRKEVASQYI